MKILVCNVGSTSLKYQIFEIPGERQLAHGGMERIGSPSSNYRHRVASEPEVNAAEHMPDHRAAIQRMISLLCDPQVGTLADLSELDGIGFKVVGGRGVRGATILDEQVLAAMAEYIPLLPAHNPPYIAAIRQFRNILPDVPLVGLFETAFHESMPPRAYLYSVPYEWYENYGVRRLGYHGASFRYISERVPQMLDRPPESLRIVACHLGGSSSVCAIQGGKSIDTSMGMSAQAGLPMTNRCGDVDPFVLPYVMDQTGLSTEEIRKVLVTRGGLLGISGVSGDVRDLEIAAAKGDDRARLALEVYVYAVKKYIGAYAAAMGGLDVIAFSGGIGENGIEIRREICNGLDFLGVDLDEQRNQVRKTEAIISKEGAKVSVVVVIANEEIVVARETARVIGENRQ